MSDLSHWKGLYARLITSNYGVVSEDSILCRAFREVSREAFVGRGPWNIFTPMGYVTTPSDDPAFLYQDVVVGLETEKVINNGQPTLHAACLEALDISGGESIVHVGAGSGYYTAILAYLVGPSGFVTAFEVDADLMQRARTNLHDYPNVKVMHRSGAIAPLPSADVVYVSAGATAPIDAWLDSLEPGGRLLFPLTPGEGDGGMLLITKRSEIRYDAKFVISAMFIPCMDARDDDTATKLTTAFKRGDWMNVTSLHRGTCPDENSWGMWDRLVAVDRRTRLGESPYRQAWAAIQLALALGDSDTRGAVK